MAGFSTSLAQSLINHVFRGQAYTPTGATYLALFVADPTDNNVTANELSSSWYVRQSVTSWAAPIGAGVTTSNSNQLNFQAVTGGSITVTHWGIYDAATTGNLLASGPWSSPKVLNVDDVLSVNAGELKLTFE